ncbi:phage tape measure protein [Campylobacter hyointestinalis subsp. hyointestinalis]|uniref:Phage tape measure protein n=2 Tax=Campylobacter hyointestinalis TaxID=198 RepID=A0A0S4SAF2_CAMHY|nr:phage tape measure protein [Campylobacter hyointestinalis subsp. hyointestinalis]
MEKNPLISFFYIIIPNLGKNMASENVEIQIQINSNAKNVTSSMKSLTGSINDTTKSVSLLGAKTKDMAQSLTYGYNAVLGLRGAFVTLSEPLFSYLKTADDFKIMSDRLSLVTKSTEELKAVNNELFAIANATNTSFSATAEVFSSLATASSSLNKSNAQTLAIIKTINQTLSISGASASSASAALFQLSQGFASGSLRGDELNSVMEQTPRLARAIADGLGISIGQLREYGASGKLSAEQVFNALEASASKVDSEFNKMQLSISGAMTNAKNSYIQLVAAFDSVNNSTGEVASAIDYYAKKVSENKAEIIEFANDFVRSLQLMGSEVIFIGANIYKTLLSIPTALTLGIENISAKIADAFGVDSLKISGLSDGLLKEWQRVDETIENVSITQRNLFSDLKEFKTDLKGVSNIGLEDMKKTKPQKQSVKLDDKSQIQNYKDLETYYRAIGDHLSAWVYKEKQLANELKNSSLNAKQKTAVLMAQKRAYLELDKAEDNRRKAQIEIEKEIDKSKFDELSYEISLVHQKAKEYEKYGVGRISIEQYIASKTEQIQKNAAKKEQEAHIKKLEYLKEYHELLGDKTKAANIATDIEAIRLKGGGANEQEIANSLYGKRQKEANYDALYSNQDMGIANTFVNRLKDIDDFQNAEMSRIEAHYARLEETKENHDKKMSELERAKFDAQIATAGAGFDMLGSLAQSFYALSGSKSKTAMRAYQAIMVGKAIVNTYTAATNAMATAGNPYLGAAMAAVAVASGLAQVAQIKAQKFHTGGYVYGAGEVPAVLQSGEGVVSRKGMANLDKLNGAGLQTTQTPEINIVNTIDPSVIESWASSRSGRKVIMNIVKG